MSWFDDQDNANAIGAARNATYVDPEAGMGVWDKLKAMFTIDDGPSPREQAIASKTAAQQQAMRDSYTADGLLRGLAPDAHRVNQPVSGSPYGGMY